MADSMTLEDRIKHFLKLAEDKGATQAERDLASAQAERLILKHQIDRASLVQDEEEKPEGQGYWIYGGRASYSMDKFIGLARVVEAMGGRVLLGDYRDSNMKAWSPLGKAALKMNIIAMSGDMPNIMRLVASLDAQGTVAMNAWWKTHELNTPGFASMKQAVFNMKHEFYRGFGRGAAERIKEELDRGITAAAAEGHGNAAVVLVERQALVQAVADAMAAGPVRATQRSGGHGAGEAGRAAGYEAAASRSRGQQAIGR